MHRRTARQRRRAALLGALAAALLMTIPPSQSLGLERAPLAVPALDADAAQAGAALAAGGCAPTDPIPGLMVQAGLVEYTETPAAGAWRTWFLGPADVAVPPPPDTASAAFAEEMAALLQVQMERTDAEILQAQSLDEGGAARFWTELMLELIVRHSAKDGTKNPPRLSRQFAMVETAMYDALVITYAAKYCYLRPPPSAMNPALDPVVPVRPLPSYPSEHVAAAAAALTILPHFFPCEDIHDKDHCEEQPVFWEQWMHNITRSRLVAGTNYPSDIAAAIAIGEAAAAAVMAARADDGAFAAWDGSQPADFPCKWTPTPPGFRADPVEPMWGHVKPWVMVSGDQFRPGPPPACEGADMMAQTYDLFVVSQSLTDRQRAIAEYWAGGQGTETPPGQNLHIALNATIERDLGTMHQARILAYAAAAIADAAIAAWDAKFAYWFERPVTTIRRHWDPTWASAIATPPFPGYVSGHSTFSGAATAFLAEAFPEDAWKFRAYATEAAMSRYYGGIHIRSDNEVGLQVGNAIGALTAQIAANDGAV